MRDDLMVEIDECDHHEAADEDEQEDRPDAEPEAQHGQEEEHAGQGLDGGVQPGDAASASPAPASEQQKAEHRDIVVPPNRDAADRATGSGPDETFTLGEAMDTDVQEAANDQPYKGADDPFLYAHDATGPGPDPL